MPVNAFPRIAPSNGWTPGWYGAFRALFGTYLFVHFTELVPWAAELFSNRGALPRGTDSPLIHLFPNVLVVWDNPAFATALLAIAAGLSVLFAIGCYDRLAAVLLWYIWACLHGRMPLITNPGMPYVGWLLLAHVCVPPCPGALRLISGRGNPAGSWHMPPLIYTGAWLLMALGYSYSGYTKLVSPSWLDGTALAYVLDNPLARPGVLREFLLTLPPDLLRCASWAALALELGFTPLALLHRTRPWIWLAMLPMHLSLMAVVDFVDLSLGMVMLHLFTFNPSWVQAVGRVLGPPKPNAGLGQPVEHGCSQLTVSRFPIRAVPPGRLRDNLEPLRGIEGRD